MRHLLATTLVMMSLSTAMAQQANETTMLTCTYTGKLLGAPSYSLTVATREDGRDQYFLNKIPQNPTAGILRTEVPRPLTYGGTWIVTLDQGRSGFAHLYSSTNTTVIDINLFQMRDTGINTNGPLTEYSCR